MACDEFASQAKTSVDCARLGRLTTYARRPDSRHTTSVTVHGRVDGTVDVHLARGALAARHLLARPVATVQVAPLWCEPVLLHGAARRLPGVSDAGDLVFHLVPAAVRVGSPPVLVDNAAYSSAQPDPLRQDAPAVLAHLNDEHTRALAACLRAGGHEVEFARATRLDAGGLTVLAVRSAGADTVRLAFPTPVASLTELPPSLGLILTPHCGCASTRRSRHSPDVTGDRPSPLPRTQAPPTGDAS